jgi:hypothetical protein
MRIPMISLMAAGALALGGCTDMYGYNGLGVGVGYGGGYGGYGSYGGYGYSPYGGYYGSSYGYPYASYGYGYGSPYYGWYDNYYYPGTGYYVYDTYRRAYPMSSTQRTYWSKRSPALSTRSTTTTRVKPNWSGFKAQAQSRRDDRQAAREARRQARER